MLVPPKQRMRIHQFDAKTQEDAFTVSLEGLKGVRSNPYPILPFGGPLFLPRGCNHISILIYKSFFLPFNHLIMLITQWNVNALFLESAQAREDRKKRGSWSIFPSAIVVGLIRVLFPYSIYPLSTRLLIHIIRRTEQQKELKRLAKLQIHPGVATANPMASGATPTTGRRDPPTNECNIARCTTATYPRSSTGSIRERTKMTGGGTPKPSAGTPRPSSRATNATPGLSNTATLSAGPPAGQTGTAGNSSGCATSQELPGQSQQFRGRAQRSRGLDRRVSANKQAGAGLQQQRTGTPAGVRPSTPMDVDSGQRGKKRERDDSLPNGGVHAHGNPHVVNNALPNGNGYANGAPNGGVAAEAGYHECEGGHGEHSATAYQKAEDGEFAA